MDIHDIASYVVRTYNLDERKRLQLALELIAGTDVRPEAAAYIQEAIRGQAGQIGGLVSHDRVVAFLDSLGNDVP